MKPKIRIGLDARPLSTPMSGVGRLLNGTLEHFPGREDFEFYFYSHNPIHPHHAELMRHPNFHWVQGKGLLSRKGASYFNIQLPCDLALDPVDLFWGTQQVLPPFLSSRTRAVLTFNDLVLYLYPETMRPLARIQQRLFQSYSVRRADCIVAISEATKRDLVEKFGYNPERVSVGYPGVDPSRFSVSAPTDGADFSKDWNHSIARLRSQVTDIPKPYILSVSTVEPRKNYPFLLSVFEKLRDSPSVSSNANIPIPNENIQNHSIPKPVWVIAGKIGWESPQFLDTLKTQAERYGDIVILDGLSDAEIHYLYKNASLFWMASLYEGFGIPLLEALAYNLPCLVSDIAPFREIGGDRIAYLPTVSNESSGRWMEETRKLLETRPKPKIDLNAFSWEQSGRAIREAFAMALASPKKP